MEAAMNTLDVASLPSRRAWLKRAEVDLLHRVEQRFVALGGAWHASDPLYQRLWRTLARVRRELSQADGRRE
jgi:hypothetical protein